MRELVAAWCVSLSLLPMLTCVACDAEETGDQQPDAGVLKGAWIAIQAGTFTMGSPVSEPCHDNDEDQHQVTLMHDFEISNHEVTQGEFQAVMGYNPSNFGPNGSNPICGTSCPVEMVSWHEAVVYCNALSGQKGLEQCYSCIGSGASVTCQPSAACTGQNIYTCSGYRLPTDAEWEYAYRAGTTTAFYNGANDPAKCYACSSGGDANANAIGWYGCTSFGRTTHPVGQKQPNAWGLYDMAGNVDELCHDWYQRSLGFSAVTDPVGSKSTYRVFRGGSWPYNASYLRASARGHLLPIDRSYDIGFRCARTTTP